MSKLAIVIVVAAVSGAAGYGIADREIVTPAALTGETQPMIELAPSASLSLQDGGFAGQGAGNDVPRLLDRDRRTQSYGTVCSTPQGACETSPKPLNAPCKCGDVSGRVKR